MSTSKSHISKLCLSSSAVPMSLPSVSTCQQCQHVISILSPSLCCCKTITLAIYLPLAMFLPSHRVNFQTCLCFNYYCGISSIISVSVISVSVSDVVWCLCWQESGENQPYCWRNLFSCINLLRILNKLTKWKHSRTMVRQSRTLVNHSRTLVNHSRPMVS